MRSFDAVYSTASPQRTNAASPTSAVARWKETYDRIGRTASAARKGRRHRRYSVMSMTADDVWMAEALAEARAAAAAGEVPVGAIVVRDDVVLARVSNRTLRDQDATAHAEVLAIRAASASIGSWRLEGCTLFVTLEPCAMC